MPLYRYKCKKCGEEFTAIMKPPAADVKDCKCGGAGERLLNRTLDPTVKVVLDKYRRKSVLRNINKIMRERSFWYQKNHELGDMVKKHGFEAVSKNSNFFDAETGLVKKDKKKTKS